MVGSSLLHYEITAKLGEGGMGEVYRARDTRLGREVAIKVLPEALSRDAERLARFEREAQVLAALNHPNIAGIHGLEEEGQRRFLVLELVDGADLRERLSQGRLDTDEALRIADRMAAGIAAAHDAGIVHRDLKPANVMITPAGQVKVLDFGLAKPEVTGADSTALSQSPTLTAQMTEAGVILGTAGYMSPEQARGREADKRSDVWSFGVILYEMLSGAAAFEGETVTDRLASVLKDTPDLSRLPPEVPPRVRWLLGRCLERDPERRLRDLGDARLVLREDGAAIATEEPPPHRSGRIGALVAGAAVVAFVVGFLGARFLGSPEPGLVDRPLRQVSILTPPLRFRSWSSNVALTPDGETLAFETETGIQIRDLSGSESRSLPITVQSREPFFSPDGRWLGYKSDETMSVDKIFLDGGSPMRLFDEIRIANQGTWSEDGTIYYGGIADGERGLHAVSEAGGDRRLVHEVTEAEVSVPFAEVLPGGRYLLWTVYRVGWGPGSADIELHDLERDETRVLFRGAGQARYSATGHLVAVTGAGVLSAIPFDLESLEVTGPPRRLVSGVRASHDGFNANFAISRGGTLAYVPGAGVEGLFELAWLDRQCGLEPVTAERRWYDEARLSPDGRYVLAAIRELKRKDLWLIDLERQTLVRLFVSEEGTGVTGEPVWMPDSRSFVYLARDPAEQGAPWKILRSSLGAQASEVVLSGIDARPTDAFADGSGFLLDVHDERGDWSVYSFDGETTSELVASPDYHELSGRLSPDGRWLAFVSFRTGNPLVTVRPSDGSGRDVQVSSEVGLHPFWSPGGTELFWDSDGHLFTAEVTTSEGRFEASAPRELCPDLRIEEAFDAAPDGERFLVRVAESDGEATEIRVIENWPALLEGER